MVKQHSLDSKGRNALRLRGLMKCVISGGIWVLEHGGLLVKDMFSLSDGDD